MTGVSVSRMMGLVLIALLLPFTGHAAAADTVANRVYGAWHSGVIGGGGYLQQVHFCPTDPNRLYMSSDVGGLFRSDDRGQTWHMLHGALPPGGGAYEIRGLLVDPQDADHVLIACGSPWGANKGIFITRDGGKSWTQTLKAMFPGNGDSRNQGKILVASPRDPRLILAAADEGVFRSEDFGQTWVPLAYPSNLFSPGDIVFDRTNPSCVWLCVAGWRKEKVMGLFFSDNEGRSFTKIADKSPSEFVQDPADPKVLLGLIDQRPARSTDGGKTWKPFDQGLPAKTDDARTDGQYAAIAAGPDFVLLGGHGGTFYRLERRKGSSLSSPAASTWSRISCDSVDEGNWWGRMRPDAYRHFGSALGYVAINPRDPQNWYFTDWYACYGTTDAGKHWKLLIDGVEMVVIHTVVPDPAQEGLVHVGMADLGYFRSTDGGDHLAWNSNGISNNIKSIATCPAKPGRLYAVGPQRWEWHANQVFVSDDSGNSWRRPAMKGLPDMAERRCNTIVANPRNGDEVYLTVSGPIEPAGGGVYRSTDAGQTWTWMGQGLPREDRLFRTDIWVHGPELAVSADGTLVAISCDRNVMFRYEPAAGTWEAVKRPNAGESGGTNGIVSDPSTAGRFYLVMKEAGLWRSNDSGKTWQQLVSAGVYWVAVDSRNPQRLAAVTSVGVIASNDLGKTWIEMETTLPYRHPRNVVAVAGDRVFVGTGGNGVFWAPFPTGVGQPRVATAALPAPPAPVASAKPGSPAAPAKSLIRNGDMTMGTGTPSNWEFSSYKVGAPTLTRDTTTFHSAPASLLIDTHGTATSFAMQKLEPLPVGPVSLRGFIKSQGQFKALTIAVQVFDGQWKQIDWQTVATPKAGDWQEFQGSFTLPAKAAAAFVGVSFEGNGQIWLDDVFAPAAGTSAGQRAAAADGGQPAVAPLPVRVPANDRNIRYVGRFDLSDPASARAAWPGSSAIVRFRGTAVNAVLEGGPNTRFQVVVDGKPTQVITAASRQTVSVATGLPEGEHTLGITKITEPIFGTASFDGFELSQGATVLPPVPATRRIEIIGDSISAGYGNEAANQNERFSHTTENAYLAYGAIAARRLNADVHLIAWSGKCMAPKNTIPEIYDRIIPQEASSPKADASVWQPDVVVINLGTNDFAGGNPDRATWVAAYKSFVGTLRKQYARATIFCAIGPMLSDPYSPSKNALSTCRGCLQQIVDEARAASDTRVCFLEFPMQDGSNGFGADWHPSLKQHEAMAATLTKTLRDTMGW